MRMRFWFYTLVMVAMALAACSSNKDPRPLFQASIFSDPASDGDIAFDPVLQTVTVTQGPDTLFFGIDDQDPHLPEYRAFLDFPLDGTGGDDGVPSNARIVSANLDIFIETVRFAPIVPTVIDLVSYPIRGLRAEDFDLPPLKSLAFDLFASDQGRFVSIDVTELMQEAQHLSLAEFQVRFLLDLAATAGLVGIEDRPTVALTAPLLTVFYEY